MKMSLRTLISTSLLIMSILPVVVHAQRDLIRRDPIDINCGDIFENVIETSYEDHTYVIRLKAGDKVNASVAPIGDLLKTGIYLYNDVSNKILAASDPEIVLNEDSTNYYSFNAEETPTMVSPLLSANGEYGIHVINYNWHNPQYNSGGIGIYTISVGCILRDGTVINPGDKPAVKGNGDVSTNAPTALVFSGVGFPGLAPVDFSSAFKVSLNFDEPNDGEIPTTGNNVLGFKFKANADDKMNLSFTRTSGNLNLGLVVLSSSNQVIYMAALVNSEYMSTLFSLPEEGEYTIGVFRLDLLPPAAPVATAFQIQAKLNS